MQLAAGVLVGLSFRKELLSPKLLPYALLAALAFLALALLLAFLLAKPLGQPPKALLFALAPGDHGHGAPEPGRGGSPALVGVFHTVRVLALFLLVPLLARLLR